MPRFLINACILMIVMVGWAIVIGLVPTMAAGQRVVTDFDKIPSLVADWVHNDRPEEGFDKGTYQALPTCALLSRDYRDNNGNGDNIVNLSIVYGLDLGDFHQPEICMEGSGWKRLSSRVIWMRPRGGIQTELNGGVVVTELRRAIESAGGSITSWDPKSRMALAEFSGTKITVRIGQRTAAVGDHTVTLRSLPYINERWRTVVDVAFLKSLLGERLGVNKRYQATIVTMTDNYRDIVMVYWFYMDGKVAPEMGKLKTLAVLSALKRALLGIGQLEPSAMVKFTAPIVADEETAKNSAIKLSELLEPSIVSLAKKPAKYEPSDSVYKRLESWR